jgi:hypothetical protein
MEEKDTKANDLSQTRIDDVCSTLLVECDENDCEVDEVAEEVQRTFQRLHGIPSGSYFLCDQKKGLYLDPDYDENGNPVLYVNIEIEPEIRMEDLRKAEKLAAGSTLSTGREIRDRLRRYGLSEDDFV